MTILIIGGDSKLAKALLPLLKDHHVTITTKTTYNLAKNKDIYLGEFDCVILCACDFKRGRSDEEQRKRWKVNVEGVINALENVMYEKVVFVSSYLSCVNNAYGNQKKAVEEYIINRKEKYCIIRPTHIKDKKGYNIVAKKILEGINSNENWCCDISV